jgi:beta-N-acetylhexosaminidase
MVGLPGPELTPETSRRLRDLDPAGVILFDRNLVEPEQTAALLASVKGLLSGPPLFAIDQEGGRVSRLERWIGATPTALDLSGGSAETVRRFARDTGSALKALGFNLDFAPVVDLCPPDAPNGIGDRSFGTDPEQVTRLAGEFLRGLHDGGVAGCLKHFPGLGDTVVDSHVELPTVGREAEQLEREDLLPYRRLCGEADSVMVGHGYYASLDPEGPVPASCSPNVVSALLRSGLGYDGLVVSDDLEMGAVSGLDVDGAAAVRALHAGCDLLLYCADLDRAQRARQALDDAARRDRVLRSRLGDACRRVALAARRWSGAAADLVAWEQARDALSRPA